MKTAVKKKIKNCAELNEDENTIQPNLRDTSEGISQWQVHDTEDPLNNWRNLISNLMTHLRVIEQQEQIIPKRVEEKKSKL